MITFRVLGPLEIDIDGGPITLSGQRQRALIVSLLLRPSTVVSVDRLVDTLWDEDDAPERATNALHQLVSRVRSQLGPAGRVVRTQPPGYVVRSEDVTTDAQRFEQGCRTARELWTSGDPASAAVVLDDALALWRGPAYGEFADSFAREESIRLEDLRTSALEDRAALHLSAGEHTEAITGARELLAAQPFRERPVELLMRALHASGRTPEALEAFRSYRTSLADELGLDAPATLRELETQILQDQEVAPRPSRPSATTSPPTTSSHRELPWLPGAMLGRERDLALLWRCLADRRLITLVGPGGVGKTRLALEVAHELVDEGFTVWWADLSMVEPHRLLDVVADAVGVDLPRGPDPTGVLINELRSHRGTLCLDNAETVLAELALVVERLAQAAPDLVVLATSRERLAVASEHVHLLAPLPLPAEGDQDSPTVRLFLDRAPGLERDALSEDDLSTVAELCRRLDGLPLAIELGAARTAAFGLRELAAQLGEGLDLLGGGRRTAAARHRTLRAVVDWSYGLITEEEALLFARLTAFPGRFSLEAAAAVCADERLRRATVGPLLARLVDQSLVQSGHGELWLLETLRAYASERLEAVDRLALRGRHAQVTASRLAELCNRLSTPDEAGAVSAITTLMPDLHAAWAFAAEHDRRLAVTLAAEVGRYAYSRQRLDLLEWGREVSTWDIDHPRLPVALAAAAAEAWASGRMADAREITGRAITAAGGDDVPSAASAVMQRGNLCMFEGDTDGAVAHFRRAVSLFGSDGRPVEALNERISVAQALVYGGRADEARAALDEVWADVRASENPSTLAWAHYVRGEALIESDPAAARLEYEAAVAAGTSVDNRLFVALARSSMVISLARDGEPHQTAAEFDRLLVHWQDIGNEAALWWVLLHLVRLLARTGADREALVLAGAVLAHRESLPLFYRDEPWLQDIVLALRGRVGAATAEPALAQGAALSLVDATAIGRAACAAPGTRERGVEVRTASVALTEPGGGGAG